MVHHSMNLGPKGRDWQFQADSLVGRQGVHELTPRGDASTRQQSSHLADELAESDTVSGSAPANFWQSTTRSGASRLGAKSLVAILAVVVFAAAFLFYFYGLASVAPHFMIARGSVTVEMTGPGILDATNKVTITSRIPGFLKTISVERNDAVKAGQDIAQLDANDIQNQLEAARAEAVAAQSAILEANANEARTLAALDKANSDLVRRRRLSQTGVVSAVDIETLEIGVRLAQAEHDRTKALADRAQAQALAATAQVGVLEHKRAEAVIRSPLNGVVVSRERSVGDLLSPGAQLFQLVDPATIFVSTRLDESIMGLIEPGQQVALRFTSDPMHVVHAQVARVGRTVDPETREFVVEVAPEQLPRNWALGQRVNVAIKVPLPEDSLVVPQLFVAHRGGRAGVWRVVEGRATWTPVEVGAVSGIYLQLHGGISPGDIIVHPKGRYAFEPVAVEVSK
jgi:HlyD family secretion protein